MESVQTQPTVETIKPESYFQKNKKLILLVLGLLLIICGLLAYILFFNKPVSNPNIENPVSVPVVIKPVPQPIVSSPESNSYNPVLPDGWSYVNASDCGVDIPVPPASGIYYEDLGTIFRKWFFVNNDTAGTTYPFKKGALVIYADFNKDNGAQLGNDSNGNNFHLTCEDGEMTNEQVKTLFDNYYSTNDISSSVSFGGTEKRWGEDAQIIIFQSEHFGPTTDYIIRKNNRTYLINFSNGINDVPEQISNNIVFNN